MSGRRPHHDFTENLEAVARGVRRLDEIRDPILREAVAAALRLRARELRLDPASRTRMRNTVLAALEPAKPTFADRLYGVFAVIGKPAPLLVRALAIVVIIAGLLGSATAASADSLPDDPLYAFKLAGEQLRLAIAVSAEDRAAVQLSIAEHRLAEAERLATSGREDAAIVATASYGSSLADAAAELASVEASDPRTSALVQQLEANLAASQQRVVATATKLAGDARTASGAKILASVSATAAPNSDSPATKIADQAAAITAKVATVAGERANGPAPRSAKPAATRSGTPTATVGVATKTEAPRATGTARVPAAATPARPTATARPTQPPAAQAANGDDDDDTSDAAPTAKPAPIDLAAARVAAERAKEAAQRAQQAAEKARRAATHTATPVPTRR